MRALAAVPMAVLSAHLLAQPRTPWVDPSPHTRRTVQVEPGTTIEALDWGGQGRTLVLLTQLGQTAHIYDDWAPRLTRSYRVVGITRRGHGEAVMAPGAAMSADRLAADIAAVLDSLKVSNVVLVGHAFAGEEMSHVATRYPGRLAGLVYMDAAYDRTTVAAEAAIMRRIPNGGGGQMRPQDMESAASLTRWMSGNLGFPIPEAEVRQIARFGPDGRAEGERLPPDTARRAVAGMMPIDYASIRVPVLALYATRSATDVAPGCRAPADEAVRTACAELFEWTTQQLARSQALVKTMGGRTDIVQLPGTHAFVFLPYEREITQAVDRFAATLR